MNGRSENDESILPPSLRENEPHPEQIAASLPERYQLHLWISTAEHRFLERLSRANDEPVARIVRRAIRQMRLQYELHG